MRGAERLFRGPAVAGQVCPLLGPGAHGVATRYLTPPLALGTWFWERATFHPTIQRPRESPAAAGGGGGVPAPGKHTAAGRVNRGSNGTYVRAGRRSASRGPGGVLTPGGDGPRSPRGSAAAPRPRAPGLRGALRASFREGRPARPRACGPPLLRGARGCRTGGGRGRRGACGDPGPARSGTRARRPRPGARGEEPAGGGAQGSGGRARPRRRSGERGARPAAAPRPAVPPRPPP